MKRFTCVLLLIVQISFLGFAQDNPVTAIKEKIRDVKLAEEFVFAESTSITSPDDALKAAENSLHTHAVNWLVGLGKNKEAAEATWNTAKESFLTLKYQNLNLHKVFVYIPKNNIINTSTSVLTDGVIAQVASQKTETAPSTQLAAAAAAPATEPPLINMDDFDISEEELEQPLNQNISALLALDSYQSVIFYLDAMQDDARLVYGRIATLTSPEQAYLIIVKDSKLITILDKGKGERMNLRTKQMEIVSKYRGYAIIWMKTFN